MNKVTSFVLFILIIIIAICLMKPSGYEQIQAKKDLKHKNELDSLEKFYQDSLTRLNYQHLLIFQEYVRKLDRANGETKHWKNKHNEEYKRNRTFTDHESDSLIRAIR